MVSQPKRTSHLNCKEGWQSPLPHSAQACRSDPQEWPQSLWFISSGMGCWGLSLSASGAPDLFIRAWEGGQVSGCLQVLCHLSHFSSLILKPQGLKGKVGLQEPGWLSNAKLWGIAANEVKKTQIEQGHKNTKDPAIRHLCLCTPSPPWPHAANNKSLPRIRTRLPDAGHVSLVLEDDHLDNGQCSDNRLPRFSANSAGTAEEWPGSADCQAPREPVE